MCTETCSEHSPFLSHLQQGTKKTQRGDLQVKELGSRKPLASSSMAPFTHCCCRTVAKTLRYHWYLHSLLTNPCFSKEWLTAGFSLLKQDTELQAVSEPNDILCEDHYKKALLVDTGKKPTFCPHRYAGSFTKPLNFIMLLTSHCQHHLNILNFILPMSMTY